MGAVYFVVYREVEISEHLAVVLKVFIASVDYDIANLPVDFFVDFELEAAKETRKKVYIHHLRK